MNKEIIIEADALMDSVVSQLDQGMAVAITGCGDSMKPFIENGEDKVVLEKIPDGKEICVGEICLYKRLNGKYAIHRIFAVQEECFSAVGDSQFFIEKDIPKCNLVAIVSRIIKKDGTQIDCLNSEFIRDNALIMKQRIEKNRQKVKIKRLIRLPISAAKKILFIFGKKQYEKRI